jgi:hypothetical protein
MLQRLSSSFRNLIAKCFGRRAPEPGAGSRFSLDRSDVVSPGKPKAVVEWEAASKQTLNPNASPEELCGLTPGMTPDEIRERLAMLYRRHNRAAASLDAALRSEAETMLDAIVQCRERLTGRKPAPAGTSAKAGPAKRGAS